MKSIEQIEAEALYFRMYRSYLLQLPKLREDYEILRDHCETHKGCLQGLTKNDLLRIKTIQDDILNNRNSLFTGTLTLASDLPAELKKEKSSQGHKDMCDTIVRNKEYLLEPFTGCIDFMNREHPTGFGLVDIIAQNGPVMYVVEVKTEAADHSIVGQIMKYYIGMALKIQLRLYDEVRMICICPGYDQASFNGLRGIGATPLLIARDLSHTEIFGK